MALTEQERRRERHLRATYGIGIKEYNEILDKQGNACAICRRDASEFSKNMAVDHDHRTLRVRGILCAYCNHRIVGRHRDSDLLRRVADYLDQGTEFYVPEKKRKKSNGRKNPRT
jgi:DNA-directed RNA polymerase subunit RPC12/RpoP